jgi:lipopolysaccharide biosynthesis protein
MNKSKKPNKVKAIAFYLPQFHEVEENNMWWGKGFTEWSNVQKGFPLFQGHYQKRMPGELGYYDLINDKTIQKKQIQLAKEYDIYGFCYYYYWFKEKRLLEKPLNQFLNNKALDFPFCIMWANHDWVRKYCGGGNDNTILIKQEHSKISDIKFICDLIPLFKDDRYIKINGKPLVIIYQIYLLEDPLNTIKVWRKICKAHGFKDLHVCIVKQGTAASPIPYGADSLVEFPPHMTNPTNISTKVKYTINDFKGVIWSYKSVVASALQLKKQPFTLFRTCMLHWDNTARLKEYAHIFHEFNPELYKKWLLACSDYVRKYNSEEEQIIFINAWNEWSEGSYLEPDKVYGRKLLEITKEVLNMV